ncbi:MAG: homoserine dehydrogenase [Anaerolineae bacterium]
MRIIVVGFGTVGQGFVQLLRDQGAHLRQAYGLSANVVGVATRSRGVLYHPNGLNLDALLMAAQQGSFDAYPHSPGLTRDWTTEELIMHSSAEVMIEATPSNLQTGQPATDYCLRALDTRKHVILANKGVVALHYARVKAAADAVQKQVRFEATVMSGTPAISLAQQGLAGATITRARGILNGTTNFMLTLMETGATYQDALAEAQRLGYAEADPSADVDGWDAAGKALIIANTVLGGHLTMDDMAVEGIAQLTPADIRDAQTTGARYRLIAEVTPTGGSVHPVRLPLSDPLAAVKGAMNAITYDTEPLGPITLIGVGAGRLQTGFGLLADLLAIRAVS